MIAAGCCFLIRSQAIDDMESFVARDLDSRRNALVGVNLCFSAAAFAAKVLESVAGALNNGGGGGGGRDGDAG